MVYFAKVDRWFAALIGGIVVLEFGTGLSIIVSSQIKGSPPFWDALGLGAVLFAGGAFLALMLYGCYRIRYELTGPELIIRFGPFRKAVSVSSIVEVFPTHNPLSAPAPSFDRLRVNYRRTDGKHRFLLISPKDRETFVRDLAGVATQLLPTGEGPLRLKASGVV